MKIFISHQHTDSILSAHIAARLKHYHSIDSYLDVIDPSVKIGEDLALHIQVEMSRCTQLIAVISDATRLSWWVPWEIGVATEKDFPLATYSSGGQLPPEYLRKWPYLRSDNDIDSYARASRVALGSYTKNRGTLTEEVARVRSNREFYVELRRSLGQ